MTQQHSEPIFNVPLAVVATISLCALIHILRTFWLSPDDDLLFLLNFAFIPARYDPSIFLNDPIPGGLGAQVWSFVTYAFIHADLTHITVNSIWLLPFGSAVARRFGTLRYFAFFSATAACGAALHLFTHLGAFSPMVGASAAISGLMGAALRFIFQYGGPLGLFRHVSDEAYHVPAEPLRSAMRNPQVLIFLVVWFGINILFGWGSVAMPGGEQAIAWQAHIGGFLSGLFLFAIFDPVKHKRAFE